MSIDNEKPELQLVKGQAIRQRKAGHKVISIQLHCFAKTCKAVGTSLAGSVTVRLTSRQPPAKLVNIQPQGSPCPLAKLGMLR
jgi:hypothetical protein